MTAAATAKAAVAGRLQHAHTTSPEQHQQPPIPCPPVCISSSISSHAPWWQVYHNRKHPRGAVHWSHWDGLHPSSEGATQVHLHMQYSQSALNT